MCHFVGTAFFLISTVLSVVESMKKETMVMMIVKSLADTESTGWLTEVE